MKMMMDVTEYVELPGIPSTLAAFAEAVYLAKGIYRTAPIEFVVPTTVLRDLLRGVDEYGRTAASIAQGGLVSIADIALVQTDKDVPVRLVFARETHAVLPRVGGQND